MPQIMLNYGDIDQSITPFYAAVKRTFVALCSTTSIHGLKYTRDKDTNKKVRAIWMFIVLLSLFAAISMVISFHMQYRNNITRMTIENYVPVQTLEWPAVTVCPETMFNIAQTKRYLATLKFPAGSHSIKQTIEDLRVAYRFIDEDVSDLTKHVTEDTHHFGKPKRSGAARCPKEHPPYEMNHSIKHLQNLLDYNNISTMTFMENTQWQCKDIVFRCRFQGKPDDCKELFGRSKTAFGFCCSFNLKQEGLHYTGYQARANFVNGLSLILYHNDTDNEEFPTITNGFKLLVSDNSAFPGFFTAMKFVAPRRENFINMRPTATYSSESVKKLAITDRKCAFSHEYPLRHFQTNEGVNCAIECRINKTIKLCGCLPYYYDSSWTDDPICNFRDIPCLLENFAVLIGRFITDQCACPSHCDVVSFELELTNTILDVGVRPVNDFYDDIQPDYSAVFIFIDSQIYARYKLDLIYNKLILISNLGSAFSLALGMSMVSVIEILYYITIILRKFYKQEIDMRKKLQMLAFIKWKKKTQMSKEIN